MPPKDFFMVFVKVHERRGPGGRVLRVVAVCDEELVGKVFREGGRELDLRKYAAFYKGRVVGEGEVVELIRGAENVNLVGERAVAAAEKALGSRAGVRRIAGVPHLQVYRV